MELKLSGKCGVNYLENVACETLDMGKAIHFAKTIDAQLIADLFRYYAGMAPEIDGATRPVAPPPNHTLKHVTIVREPLGVVVVITPFNFPLILAGAKIATALGLSLNWVGEESWQSFQRLGYGYDRCVISQVFWSMPFAANLKQNLLLATFIPPRERKPKRFFGR